MLLRPWKTISSQYLSKSPWISLRAEKCETADGHTIDPYYVVEMPDWVHIIAFDKDEKVITTLQYRHAMREVFWEIPCGEIDEKDPSPMDAAKRELLEETGYQASEWIDLGVMYPNPARQTNKFHNMLALGAKKVAEPNLDVAEEMTHQLSSVEELLVSIKSGKFMHGIHVASLLRALMELGKI